MQTLEPHAKEAVAEVFGTVRAEDTGHLVTFACFHTDNDISNTNTDIIAYNKYPCWYSWALAEGTPEEMRRNIRSCHESVVRDFRKKYGDGRPIIVYIAPSKPVWDGLQGRGNPSREMY